MYPLKIEGFQEGIQTLSMKSILLMCETTYRSGEQVLI